MEKAGVLLISSIQIKKSTTAHWIYNDQASLDCAREMMESFSLKCLEITKKIPKI